MRKTATRRRAETRRLLLILAVGIAAYLNSFSGAFVLDDRPAIINNLQIRHLWPPWKTMAGSLRPLTKLSLAINYALGRLNPWGYHLVNLAVHLLAALTLFGIIRRTLSREPLRNRYGPNAPRLAMLAALIWAVHPIQTESVTYIIQRAESLMGMFYFLTIYGLIRTAEAPDPLSKNLWTAATISFCALGMASKPVMVTAPLAVLLYDRVFLSTSLKEALRRRRLYLGLASCWVLLAGLLISASEPSAGFRSALNPLAYAAAQPGVTLHYLKLSLWPHPLCLDYNWPLPKNPVEILFPLLVAGSLLALALFCVRRLPSAGFLGIWFFLTLSPSSSFIPLNDLAFEHRLYVPLAAIAVLGVLGTENLFHRFKIPDTFQRLTAVGIIFVLALLTILRNQDYRSELSIWSDTAAKRPENPRAHYNLGNALAEQGLFKEATTSYTEAIRLKHNYAEAHSNWGFALARQGQWQGALTHYREAIRLKPQLAEVHNNLGLALTHLGKREEAIDQFNETLRLDPRFSEARNNWGNVLAQQGRFQEAIRQYELALQINPNSAEAYYNLGNIFAQQGQPNEAIRHYAEALRLKPAYSQARDNLNALLSESGQR